MYHLPPEPTSPCAETSLEHLGFRGQKVLRLDSSRSILSIASCGSVGPYSSSQFPTNAIHPLRTASRLPPPSYMNPHSNRSRTTHSSRCMSRRSHPTPSTKYPRNGSISTRILGSQKGPSYLQHPHYSHCCHLRNRFDRTSCDARNPIVPPQRYLAPIPSRFPTSHAEKLVTCEYPSFAIVAFDVVVVEVP